MFARTMNFIFGLIFSHRAQNLRFVTNLPVRNWSWKVLGFDILEFLIDFYFKESQTYNFQFPEIFHQAKVNYKHPGR
jgi:hypothetical protein